MLTLICRAANFHALSVRLTQMTPLYVSMSLKFKRLLTRDSKDLLSSEGTAPFQKGCQCQIRGDNGGDSGRNSRGNSGRQCRKQYKKGKSRKLFVEQSPSGAYFKVRSTRWQVIIHTRAHTHTHGRTHLGAGSELNTDINIDMNGVIDVYNNTPSPAEWSCYQN